MSRTKHISFFHGTSAFAAANILEHGPRNIFTDLQLNDLTRAIWQAILAHAGSPSATGSIFEKAGCPVEASVALENAALGKQNSLVSYGDFYVSMPFRVACNFAVLRPRGEIFSLIEIGMRVLEHIQSSAQNDIIKRFPEATLASTAQSHPVVLEISGVDEAQIAREDGRSDCWTLIELALKYDNMSANNDMPFNFRLTGVTRAQTVFVYDLRRWSERMIAEGNWLPSRVDIDSAKLSSESWLAEHEP
jgi:hypothetical protein